VVVEFPETSGAGAVSAGGGGAGVGACACADDVHRHTAHANRKM